MLVSQRNIPTPIGPGNGSRRINGPDDIALAALCQTLFRPSDAACGAPLQHKDGVHIHHDQHARRPLQQIAGSVQGALHGA